MNIFNDVEKLLINYKLNYSSKDLDRPWGGFYVINELLSKDFFSIFFHSSYLKK